MIAAVTIAAVVVAVAVLAWWLRRRATPAELRGDWWPQFERELHSYARRAHQGQAPAGETQRRPRR